MTLRAPNAMGCLRLPCLINQTAGGLEYTRTLQVEAVCAVTTQCRGQHR